jgi:type IV secretion system protein TrbL
MTPDSGVLTSLMDAFAGVFKSGVSNITVDARWLLGTLMIIDLVLAILMNLDDADHLKTLIKKILKYGFFIWLVVDWANLANIVLNSFSTIGLKAGGGGLSPAFMTDPSMTAGKGIYVAGPILDFISTLTGAMDTMLNLPKIVIMGVTAVGIILCFFIIGIQIFLTYLEFYIVATLALILIPFGVFKHTAFLSEKAIGAVLGFGIKLMVLSFIASAVIPVVNSWVVPAVPTYDQCFCTLLGSLAIAFLAWSVPGMVSGLLMGHPSLTGGGAAGFALAGAAIAGNMGSRGHNMVNNLTGAKGRAAQKNADRIGGAVASAMKTGGGAASPPPATAKIDAAEAAARFKPADNRTPPK